MAVQFPLPSLQEYYMISCWDLDYPYNTIYLAVCQDQYHQVTCAT